MAGLLLALIFGRNLSLKTYELEVQARDLGRLVCMALGLEVMPIVYIPELLPHRLLDRIRQQHRELRPALAPEGPCAARRRLAAPCTAGVAWRLFRSTWLRARLQRRAGLRLRKGKEPMEFREYGVGSSMEWHRDEVLLSPPQWELVYTLENTSDSVTCWAPGHLEVLRGEVEEVWTAPNSALLLEAGGVVHMVKELTKGHRSILKVAFQAPEQARKGGATYRPRLRLIQVVRLAKLLFVGAGLRGLSLGISVYPGGLAIFCFCWALVHWPPMDLLEQVRLPSPPKRPSRGALLCRAAGPQPDALWRWPPLRTLP